MCVLCIYIYIYIYMLYTYIYMYVSDICMYVCIYIYIYTYVCIYACIYVHVRTSAVGVCAHARACGTLTCIRAPAREATWNTYNMYDNYIVYIIYIYIYMCVHIITHIHIHIQSHTYYYIVLCHLMYMGGRTPTLRGRMQQMMVIIDTYAVFYRGIWIEFHQLWL